MSNICSNLFNRVIKDSKENGSELQHACNEQQLIQLKNQFTTTLNMQIPKEYIDFLRQMNGYSDFGLMLYASHSIYLRKSDSWIYGLVETNCRYSKFFPSILVFGECGGELLICDNESGLYKNIDRVGNNIIAEFESFWEMLDEVLKSLI